MKNFKYQIEKRLSELDSNEFIIEDSNESKSSEYLYIRNTQTNEEFSVRISNHDAICSRSKIAKHEVVYQLHKGINYVKIETDLDDINEICEEFELSPELFEIEEIGYGDVELKFTDFYRCVAELLTYKIIWN